MSAFLVIIGVRSGLTGSLDPSFWLSLAQPPPMLRVWGESIGYDRGKLSPAPMIMKAPLLSICIPAYNRPLWLRRALESIALSPGAGVEVVITDDSDTDQAQGMAAEVLGSWSGFWRYEFHPERLGMAENWNRALALAGGDYVMILHDDDFLLPDGLAGLLGKLEALQDQYPVLLFGVWVVDREERRLRRQVFRADRFLSPAEALGRLFSNSSFVRFPGIVIQRSVLGEVGFFNPFWREPCDIEMWMRLMAKYGVYCCREATAAYRVHGQALTMGSFHAETVGILLALFGELEGLAILDQGTVAACRGSFFHQYVLAGAWRQLRRWRWREFGAVMGLFELPELRALRCPRRWRFLRFLFSALVREK